MWDCRHQAAITGEFSSGRRVVSALLRVLAPASAADRQCSASRRGGGSPCVRADTGDPE